MTDESRPLVILYHAGCMDGFGASLVAQSVDRSYECIPVQHHDTPNDERLRDRQVLMFDICFPPNVLEHLRTNVVKSIHVYDHHITSQKLCGHLDYCHFDMTKSGAMLAWDYFYPDQPPPKLIQYIEDADLYTWKLPWTREINAYLASLERYIDPFLKLMSLNDDGWQDLITRGSVILDYQRGLVRALCRSQRVGWYKYEGQVSFAAVNSAVFVNEISEWLYTQNRDLDFVMVWRYDASRKKYICSMRSAKDKLDVSVIAQKHGGGGHVHASAMSLDCPPHQLQIVEPTDPPVNNKW